MKIQIGTVIKLLLMCSVAWADDLSLTSTLVGVKTERFFSSTSTVKPEASDLLHNKSCDGLTEKVRRTSVAGSDESVPCPSDQARADVMLGDANPRLSGIRRDSSLRTRDIERAQSLADPTVDSHYSSGFAVPDVGVYSAADWRSELQDVVGDANYDRMVSAYVTIKTFDQWIDASLEGYGLGQANRQMSFQLAGLNQKLNAALFSVWEPAMGLVEIDQQSGLKTNFDSKQLQEFARQTSTYGSAVDSDLLVIMQYFTLVNGLYAFLAFLCTYSLFKAIRFLLKQDLSD